MMIYAPPMIRPVLIITLLLGVFASMPAAADQRLDVRFESEAFEIAGEKFPAARETITYWFGDKVARMDLDTRMSVIVRPGKHVSILHHERRTYSEHALPVDDAAEVVGPQLAPVIRQWAVPAEAIDDIRPREAKGEYLGFQCRQTDIEISMPLLEYEIDWCDSKQLPIDYNAFRTLLGVRAVLMHGAPWMLGIAQRLGGFPLHSQMESFGAGSQFSLTEELTAIRKQSPPKGHYQVPTGYRRTRYLELIPTGQAGAN